MYDKKLRPLRDIKPKPRFARSNISLERIVERTVRLPAFLGSDLRRNVIEEVMATVLEEQCFYELTGNELQRFVRQVARRVVNRERIVYRERDDEGVVHRRVIQRISHPTQRFDGDGHAETEDGQPMYDRPQETYAVDAGGKPLAQRYERDGDGQYDLARFGNVTEDRLIERLDRKRKVRELLRRLSPDDFRFAVRYVMERERGKTASGADRVRFFRLRKFLCNGCRKKVTTRV